MNTETWYRLPPAHAVRKLIGTLLLVCALLAPGALWAQAPNCNPGETVTQNVDFTKKRFDSSDSIGPIYELQGWFEFDTIPDVTQYRLEVTEFSINTTPSTLGRRFSYNTASPPSRVDVYSLHRTNSGTLGVIVITASGRPPSTAPAFWSGITGKAVLTYTCPTPKIDIAVLATSTLTGSGDNLKATFTATLTNKGTKDAENVELTVKLSEQDGVLNSAFGATSASTKLHVLSADSRCDQQLGFLEGKVVCSGLSVAGGDVEFLEFVTRVVNASDLKDKVTMTAVVAGDIDNSNNEDTTKVTPSLVGTLADTLQAMEALAPYFDYRATPGTGRSCDRYMNDIFGRLEAIRAENPSVFANLSYGRITSGALHLGANRQSIDQDRPCRRRCVSKGQRLPRDRQSLFMARPPGHPWIVIEDSRGELEWFGEHVTSFGRFCEPETPSGYQGVTCTWELGALLSHPSQKFSGLSKRGSHGRVWIRGRLSRQQGEFRHLEAGRMPNAGEAFRPALTIMPGDARSRYR